MRLLLLAAFLLALSAPCWARGYGHDGYYRSSDGAEVHGPTSRDEATAYGPVTADCRDGTHSHSHHHRGTCSGHGGVEDWR